MIRPARLLVALLSRRSRPFVGGPAAPAPLPVPETPGSVGWHIEEAHREAVLARLRYGRFLAGLDESLSEDAITHAHAAVAHLTAFAAEAEGLVGPFETPDDLSDLEGGAQ